MIIFSTSSPNSVEGFRPIFQDVYQISCLQGGHVAFGVHQLFFFQLGLPELLGQFIGFGYKNVRINKALLLEEGQCLILTG